VCGLATEHFFQLRGGGLLHVGQYVGIGVKGEGYAGMAQPGGNHLGVNAGSEKKGRVGMAQIVKPNVLQTGLPKKGLEVLPNNVSFHERFAGMGRKYKAEECPSFCVNGIFPTRRTREKESVKPRGFGGSAPKGPMTLLFIIPS